MALLIEENGLYDFKLEVSEDILHPTFSFVQDIPPLAYELYIRGGFNGWSADNQFDLTEIRIQPAVPLAD